VHPHLVGIDLGTSNTAVAFAPPQGGGGPEALRLFEIEQFVAPGEVAPRPLLPSVRYHPAAGELSAGDLVLPWSAPELPGLPFGVVGELARDLGSQVPGRLVASAKSWLSHAAVDRQAPILPWGAGEGVARVSPLHASASYLAHVRAAWDHAFPREPLARQEVILTVPASFDEAARTLTREAARLAGLGPVRLLEEPQAAFYDWLFRHRDGIEQALGGTALALVCDVGGGTTDLTLIAAREGKLRRVAVGEHLMLGGDNMDLGLARLVEGRLGGAAPLSSARLSQLVEQCRRAKERLLSGEPPEAVNVTLLGGGARLVGGARSAELRRREVTELVVDGFFPRAQADERPRRVRGGLVELGLPYVADPAVTRHIAGFLADHAGAAREALGARAPGPGVLPVPDAVLLNGGVFRSPVLAGRVLEVLGAWRGEPPQRLCNDAPELAVARGAVAFGLARRGLAPRIGGGAARSYFIGLGAADGPRAVCVLPRGTEEGHEVVLADRAFALRVGRPAKFDLLSSTADAGYAAGEVVPVDPGAFHSLPPVAALLPAGEGSAGEVEVRLAAGLNELGSLELHCISTRAPPRRWRLDFDLRGAPAAPRGRPDYAVRLPARLGEAVELIGRFYGPRGQGVDPKGVRRLRGELERLLGPREGWDTPLLREVFVALWDGAARRRRSADHERVWHNLAGFCIRPGFGFPLDDWRVGELWTLYEQGVQSSGEAQVWAEWWTLWRRAAGGLDEAAQGRLADDLAYSLQPPGVADVPRPAGPRRLGHDDMVRLAGSLERLTSARKVQLGRWLVERLRRPAESAQSWWAVGRLGARVPFYGSAHHVVVAEVAAEWLGAVLALDWKRVQPAAFAAVLLARVSGDRERDLPEPLREAVAGRLQAVRALPAWVRMVRERVDLDEADEGRVFGESLPPGLRLIA
jgi:molecular chaperone DnaK (HSP70)